MWPTSGISGRVVDADGDPAGRVQVLALRLVYDGGKPVMTIAQTVTTNDRGEYRMFWLTPGSYRVAARAFEARLHHPSREHRPAEALRQQRAGTSPVVSRRTLESGVLREEVAIPIYSPSTPDPQLSSTIALAPGENASSVDVQLIGSRVAAHHVRGVVQILGAAPGPIPGGRGCGVARADTDGDRGRRDH